MKVLAALTHFTRPVEVKFIAELGGLSPIAARTALEDLADRALIVADAGAEEFLLTPLVAIFLRRKRPEVVAETGDRLEKHAYALIVENGGANYDRFPILKSAWHVVSPALPAFVAGSNHRLQRVFKKLKDFLDFEGHWDEQLAFSLQAESIAEAANDYRSAGLRAGVIKSGAERETPSSLPGW